MRRTIDELLARPEVAADPLMRELLAVISLPTGRTSAGWPYLAQPAWVRLRDWIPHTLAAGHALWEAAGAAEALLGDDAPVDALRVVRQVVRTAAITAPPDLWLLRCVLSALATTGWLQRMAEGIEQVPAALEPDVTLLMARGYLVRLGAGVRWSDAPIAQRVLQLPPLPQELPLDLSWRFAAAASGDRSHDALLCEVLADIPQPGAHPPPAWIATPEDLLLGYPLVPLVLGLRAAGRTEALLASPELEAPLVPGELGQRIGALLRAVGWLSGDDRWTAPGQRGLARGPGPFGIIETYHPYLALLPQLWAGQLEAPHVQRAANVAASQDANRRTFARANDALDRFCVETGFTYQVFIEHAVGRGEAIRQRRLRSGDDLIYVGADLEQAAIDEAQREADRGRLPASVRFVVADIGDPQALVAALRRQRIDPDGAVMVVGNGFHEVRGQTDARMVEVFRGYEAAGLLLLFTEENALSVDDLLHTAWNTYHAGFRYVHERSGQGLRPAGQRPVPGLGPPLRASWTECAREAGYVRATRWCSKSRTIYPYPPANGNNPSISVNHFFVPARWAAALGLSPDEAG